MKKILVLLLSCLILISSLVGCKGKVDTKEPISEPKEEKEVVLGEPKILEFDLGEVTLPQAHGPEFPVRLHGEIGVPSGEGKHPIVFVFHGSHPVTNIEKERYDLGFTYLIEKLAAKGYLTVSINVNAQYVLDYYGEPFQYERLTSIFNSHLESLQKAINGEDVGYGVDLTKRGDTTQVNLIGHSRSGQGIVYIYEDQVKRGNNNITSLLSLAPSLVIARDRPYPDVPMGVVLPELDGDVIQLAGQDIYEKLRFDDKRKSWANVVYLYGANHNFFNEELLKDDAKNAKNAKNRSDFDIRLSDIEQREFFANYSLDFMNKVYGKKVREGFSVGENAPGKMYGFKVLTSLHKPDSLVIVRPKKETNLSNSLGGKIVTSNIQIKNIFESSFFKEDTAGPFILPGIKKDLDLLNISWKSKDASVGITLPDEFKDITGYDALSLYLAVDPSNSLNKSGENQSMSLELVDKKGKISKVVLDANTPALRYHPGELASNEYTSWWSTFTPLSSVRIQLDSFEDVDLKNIEKINLLFDQTPSGSIMLAELSLMKK
ncbi:hypothetical protein OW763_14510 [Clostridium aestuarii]|uniref:Alpha/beta hydrolase n=1 Tax=Clostridium aestuarii TaxID=338193 RepID=A0ABT4D2U0_9CLOT|nr:hypothetical protein [Clostridium aestuarii]MCY6485544.1 hypothetical protein [Clostridium aestuarii]